MATQPFAQPLRPARPPLALFGRALLLICARGNGGGGLPRGPRQPSDGMRFSMTSNAYGTD
eukprot:4793750-Lingulodinium_polyedra.AAC.1